MPAPGQAYWATPSHAVFIHVPRRSVGMSGRLLIGSSVIALGIAFAAPRAVHAQNYTQQMQGYMATYAQAAQARGYQPVTAMVTGSLNQGANTSHNVTLTAGRNYVIIAV